MEWIKILDPAFCPPENVDLLLLTRSGVVLFGRNIDGEFATYDSISDKYVAEPDGSHVWRWITHYFVIKKPSN